MDGVKNIPKDAVSKATSIIVVAILLIAIAAQALYPIQVAASPSPENILLYDAFDDTTLGEIKGTVSFASSGDNGRGFDMGGSVCFDGGGTWEDYILYGAEGPQSPFVKNQGTLELWVKKVDWILAPGQREDILRTNTANNEGIHLLLYGAELWLYAQSSVPAVVYPTSGLDTGWHHFAIAWDNNSTILYIDGEDKGFGVGIIPRNNTHNTLGLSAPEELHGCIDELASYDYKKSDSEIEEDFNAQSSPHKGSPGEPQAPIADAGGPYEVTEGSRVSFDGSDSSDPDGEIESYEWHLNYDGQSYYAAGPTMSSYPLDDNYTGNITLTVTDNYGLSDTNTTTVTVSNVAPIVEAGADQTVNEDDTVSFSGSFTDPGLLDTHTIVWDFSDGSTASGTRTPTHAYGDNGVYTVTLTVTDDDGGVGSDTLTVTVPVPPRDLKEQVINCLSMYVDESKRISKVIKKIDESLEPKRWMDETHLDWKQGKKVFDYERYAVKELMHLLKGDVSDKCSGISRIVLEYTGLDPVTGEVLLKNGLLLTPFEFSPDDIDAGNTTIVVEASEATGGKLHPEIRLNIGGVEVAKIHTSCSKPIDIGDNYGNFVIDDLDKLPPKSKKSGKKDEISDEALACAQEGIAKLVEVDRILAETLIIETEGMTITDPKKQEKVNKELAKAHEELDKGDADRDAGKPDKAIKHYKKAWEHAQKAMK